MQEEEEGGIIVFRGVELHQSSVNYCKAFDNVKEYLISTIIQNYCMTNHEILVRQTIRGI